MKTMQYELYRDGEKPSEPMSRAAAYRTQAARNKIADRPYMVRPRISAKARAESESAGREIAKAIIARRKNRQISMDEAGQIKKLAEIAYNTDWGTLPVDIRNEVLGTTIVLLQTIENGIDNVHQRDRASRPTEK